MGNTVPTPRQVRRKDGTVYQAIRHMNVPGDDSAKKGWKPPQIAVSGGTDQLLYENIHNSLSKRGFSDGNIYFAIDAAVHDHDAGTVNLTAAKIMMALNDCIDELGDTDFSFADEATKVTAGRIITASIHQLPANERVMKLVKDPEIDLDRLISLVKDDGITDPARLEVLFQGGAKSLSDGAL